MSGREAVSGSPVASDAKNQIINLLDSMYDAYQRRDWDLFNSHLDPSVTAWESHLPDLIKGQTQLDEHRNSRATPRPLSSLTATNHLVDDWNDTALVRYLLIAVDEETAITLTSRITEVLRWNGSRWKIVHRHAEYLPTQPG